MVGVQIADLRRPWLKAEAINLLSTSSIPEVQLLMRQAGSELVNLNGNASELIVIVAVVVVFVVFVNANVNVTSFLESFTGFFFL